MIDKMEVLKSLGLAKNEALVYMALLQAGESPVGEISVKSRLNRRNVYDSLKRLLEKGLAFEVLKRKETHYLAVDPHKLEETLSEKQRSLAAIMPDLSAWHQGKPLRAETYVYGGLEAYKNVMRDVLRVGEDYYVIGGKSVWADPRLRDALKEFKNEARRKKIEFYLLFDHGVGKLLKDVEAYLGKNYKFLPPAFSSKSLVDVFGDHVVISSKARIAAMEDNVALTVIVNRDVADAFRAWFRFMWECSRV